MDIAGQWLKRLMPHFVCLAPASPRPGIPVLQTSEVDVGTEWSTWTMLQHCDHFCDRQLQTTIFTPMLLLLPLWICRLFYTCYFHQALSKSGFSHKSKHSFQCENTTLIAISNCCKVPNHPSSSCNKRKMTQKCKKKKKSHLTNANGQHHKDELNLWTTSLVCPLLRVISSSVDRDPSRSQHYLNSGVSVYECIIQSLANSLESISSCTPCDPVSLQGASCFTLRSTSLSWQPPAFSFLKIK